MRLVATGDNVVDCYRELGEMFPGGNCLNFAVAGRRYGATSSYIGAVGDDVAGDLIRRSLEAEGVDISRLRTLAGPSAYCFIDLDHGDRVFAESDKGVSEFTLTSSDLDYVATFDLVHVSYSSGLEDQLPELAARCPISFDFSDWQNAYAEPLLPHCTFAEFSASDLDDHEVFDLVRWAHSFGPRIVLVLRGGLGAALSDGMTIHFQPAIPTTVVDTLGAGDVFVARTLVGLCSAEPVEDLLEAAATAAAETCSSFGAFGYGIPTPIGVEARRSPVRTTNNVVSPHAARQERITHDQ